MNLIPIRETSVIANTDFTSHKKDYVNFKKGDVFKLLGVSENKTIYYVANYPSIPFSRLPDAKVGYAFAFLFDFYRVPNDHSMFVTPQIASIQKDILYNISRGVYSIPVLKSITFFNKSIIREGLKIKKAKDAKNKKQKQIIFTKKVKVVTKK